MIAILFTDDFSLGWLGAGVGLCVLYGWLQRRRCHTGWLLVPLAIAVWVCIHASGVHATVAGIALGLLTPVRPVGSESESLAERLERRLHPWSAGMVIPLFALAAAGIPVTAIGPAFGDPIAHGIVAALLVGKTIGILGGAGWLSGSVYAACLTASDGRTSSRSRCSAGSATP